MTFIFVITIPVENSHLTLNLDLSTQLEMSFNNRQQLLQVSKSLLWHLPCRPIRALRIFLNRSLIICLDICARSMTKYKRYIYAHWYLRDYIECTHCDKIQNNRAVIYHTVFSYTFNAQLACDIQFSKHRMLHGVTIAIPLSDDPTRPACHLWRRYVRGCTCACTCTRIHGALRSLRRNSTILPSRAQRVSFISECS